MGEVTISKERLEALEEAAESLKKVKDRQRNAWQRRNAKLMILKMKAEEAGITCTDEEIDEYLRA